MPGCPLPLYAQSRRGIKFSRLCQAYENYSYESDPSCFVVVEKHIKTGQKINQFKQAGFPGFVIIVR